MRLRRVPAVRQQDATDCGAACLDSIARYHGRAAPIARIRQRAGTDRGGTSLAGLIVAAEELGLKATGVRARPDALAMVPKPAIAHLADDKGRTHFVVVCAASEADVTIMDPADGRIRRELRRAFLEQWTGVLLLIAVGQPPGGRPRQVTAFSRLWRLGRPHRPALLQVTLGALAYTVLGLATAVFVQKLVDYVIPDGNRELLDLLGIGMLLLAVSQVYLGSAKDLLVLRTGQQIDAGLITDYYHHLLRLPQRFFDTMRVGEIVSRINDAVKIRAFVNEASLELVVNALVVAFSFGLMAVYSWKLALVVAVSVPVYLGLYWVANRINRREQRRTMEAAAEVEAHLVETISAASTLRRLSLESQAAQRLDVRLVRLLKPVYAVGKGSLITAGGAELVSRLTTIGLLWAGGLMVMDQHISAGELMSFYALNGHLTVPVLGLIAMNRRVQDALIATDRLFQIMDLEREQDRGQMEVPARLSRGIDFDGVSFRYGARPLLFSGLGFSIARGEFVAMVGESGVGKSTIAALLHRLYPLEGGQIRLDELDIQNIRRDSLYRSVGVVPQEVVLFEGTLLENLVPGEYDPDLTRVRRLCRMAGLLETIESLPLGLSTPLSERGTGLSGGQRQRVGIVRSLYRRPHLLVLDEATSALDPRAESIILHALRASQAEGMTILMITHRLASAQVADRIIVLGRGGVVATGIHQELVRDCREYRQLWAEQTGIVPLAGGVAEQRSG